MGISSYAEYGGLYNQYRMPEIPTVDVETVKKQDEELQEKKQQESIGLPDSSYATATAQTDNRSRIANLEDVSLTFNKEESFDYIGSESGLGLLDVQKAVSDMRKDNIIQEYQYFVGSSQAIMGKNESADGVVLQKLLAQD